MLPSFLQYIGPDFNFTLSYVIHNGFELDQDFYGCSGGVPESNYHRRQYWGVYFITIGILILILYSTCLIAIAKSDQMKTPAYKTMLFLGISDLSSTMIHSIATGILGYNGFGFCDYPRLIFTLGSIAMGSWMGCCISSMVLAFIRICDLNSQIKMRKCFAGRKIYVILLMFFIYSLYAMFLSKPLIFNPVYMSWFFDPGLGKDPTLYINVIHTFNNIMMAVSTIVFYGYLAIVFLKESRSSATKKLTKMQVTILLQTFFFCIFHAIGAAIYAYMQFFESSEFIVLVGHLAWQSSSGSVCMVYLTLNRTIRRSVVKLVCSRKYNVENYVPSIISVHPRSRANSRMFEMSNFHNFH